MSLIDTLRNFVKSPGKNISLRKSVKIMKAELERLVSLYRELGIDKQIDFDKFYLYSLITHSTAIEGSTITELENQILFDQGISLKGKSILEQNMNLDLKTAYETAISLAREHTPITVNLLKMLSALVMKNTGQTYRTALGEFSSSQGDLRLLNVTAGIGGKSYMSYNKVPSRLYEFCEWLNGIRNTSSGKSVAQLYESSFDAHYKLVTIHPWADGNGRMARLVMNMFQFETGLIPTKILKDDKEEYIKALVQTRESEYLSIFREFMTQVMISNLTKDIEAYRRSLEDQTESREKTEKGREKNGKSREKILAILKEDNTLSAREIALRIGISAKAVEKNLARMKADGLLTRIGPDKGGHWEVNKQES